MRDTQVSITHFQQNAQEILRILEETGGRVFITDGGKPIAEVRSCQSVSIDALRLLRGTVLRYVEPIAPVEAEWQAAK